MFIVIFFLIFISAYDIGVIVSVLTFNKNREIKDVKGSPYSYAYFIIGLTIQLLLLYILVALELIEIP